MEAAGVRPFAENVPVQHDQVGRQSGPEHTGGMFQPRGPGGFPRAAQNRLFQR